MRSVEHSITHSVSLLRSILCYVSDSGHVRIYAENVAEYTAKRRVKGLTCDHVKMLIPNVKLAVVSVNNLYSTKPQSL